MIGPDVAERVEKLRRARRGYPPGPRSALTGYAASLTDLLVAVDDILDLLDPAGAPRDERTAGVAQLKPLRYTLLLDYLDGDVAQYQSPACSAGATIPRVDFDAHRPGHVEVVVP